MANGSCQKVQLFPTQSKLLFSTSKFEVTPLLDWAEEMLCRALGTQPLPAQESMKVRAMWWWYEALGMACLVFLMVYRGSNFSCATLRCNEGENYADNTEEDSSPYGEYVDDWMLGMGLWRTVQLFIKWCEFEKRPLGCGWLVFPPYLLVMPSPGGKT